MPEILINVINKIPQLSGDIRQITADNADYTIRFAFDNDWREGEKRVYFVRENGFAYPVGRTTEDVAPVPSVNGVKLRTSLFVGVQQGSVKTSRPCMIPVYHAITDMIDDSAVQPEPSMWEDILARVEELEKGGGAGTAGIVVEDDGEGNVEIKNSSQARMWKSPMTDKKIMKTLNGYTVYDEDAHRRIDSLAGSAPGLVFDTVADMEAYVAEHSAELKVGQNLYIREVDVPDYWWDGTAAQELEVKEDLSGYAKQEEVDQLSKAIADKANKAGWTANKYIGTDESGNLVEKDAPTGGGTGTVTSVNGNIPDENGNVTVEVGQPTDEQIATAVGNWLDEHPEATTTVADGSITREKMAFPAYEGALSPNLADPSKFTSARFTSANGNRQTFGETSTYAEYWRMTDYIDVSNHIGEQLWVSHWQGYCFYDDAKAVISGGGQFIGSIPSVDSTDPITIPDGAVYIAIAFDTIKHPQDKTEFMANWGNSLLSYIPYGDVVLPDESVSDAQINGKLSLDKVETERLILPTVGKNLVDKSQMIKHKWLNADGTTKDTAESLGNWHVNGIKVKSNTNYLVFGGTIVFFDEYGNVCGNDIASNNIFSYRSVISPVGAATCGLNGSGCNETNRYLTYPSHMIHGEFIVEGDTLPDRVLPGKYYEKAVLEENILHDSVLHRMRDCWNPSTKTTIGLCGDSNTRGIMGNGDTTQNPKCWANLLTAEIEEKCAGERYIYPFGDIGVWGTNVYNYYEALMTCGVIRVPFYGTSIKIEFGTISAEITADVSIDDAESVETTIPADGYTWEGLTEGYHTITLAFSGNPNCTMTRFVVNKTVEIINRGIIGRNLGSLHHDLDITGDTIDLICFGTNNRVNGDVHADTRDLTMFEFRNKATNLIYMSPIPAWDSIEEANEAWKTIPYIESFIAGHEAQHNREYISLYHEIKDYCTMNNVELTSLYVEGLHLNDEGHKVVAKILCRKLGLGDLSE